MRSQSLPQDHQKLARSYQRVAAWYELSAYVYSGAAIRDTRRAAALGLGAGDRVLFAGVGAGDDAALAHRTGAAVILVDISEKMMEGACRHLQDDSRIERRVCDIHEVRDEEFDRVVANFFLNVFDAEHMPLVLEHLLSLVSEKGELVVGDFARPSLNPVVRLFQYLYYWVPLIVFRVFTGTPWHPLYDYESELVARGWEAVQRDHFRPFGCGPAWYSSTLYRRRA